MLFWQTIDLEKENLENTEILNNFFKNQEESFHEEKMKKQTKGTYVLLKRMLSSLSINLDEQEIKANQYGKPYFVSLQLFFNISHSKNLCAVAISDRPVGIDIQYLSKPNKKVASRYFDKKSQLRMKFSPKKENAFTKGWTTYESTLKLFSNLRFKSGKVKTQFFKVKDCTNQAYFVAVSTRKNWNYNLQQKSKRL